MQDALKGIALEFAHYLAFIEIKCVLQCHDDAVYMVFEDGAAVKGKQILFSNLTNYNYLGVAAYNGLT